MADNVDITAGTGTTILADELVHATYGTGKAQAVKVLLGAAGTGVDMVGGTGVDGTGVPRVTLATNVGLPAGTAAIGKVKVTNDAGTVIDPVAAGSAAMAASVPVTIATDEAWIKAEDAAHSSGDKGVMALAIKKAVAAATSATDNDYVPLVVDADGNLYVSARPGGVAYETVAASQTAQAIGATGAAGDYLSHVIVSPATAGCGVCTILDDTTEIAAFPGGGTTALSNLIPFVIPIGMKSTAGAWKITTGANIKCVAVGKFT